MSAACISHQFTVASQEWGGYPQLPEHRPLAQIKYDASLQIILQTTSLGFQHAGSRSEISWKYATANVIFIMHHALILTLSILNSCLEKNVITSDNRSVRNFIEHTCAQWFAWQRQKPIHKRTIQHWNQSQLAGIHDLNFSKFNNRYHK